MTYVLVVIFVLMNMFVTIITDAYEQVRDNPHLSPYDETLSNHMRFRFQQLKEKFLGKSKNGEISCLH